MRDFLESLLKQLVRMQLSFPEELDELYIRYKREGVQPSPQKFREILDYVICFYERCYIVVDEQDECREDEGVQEQFLQELDSLRSWMGVNVIVTCRYINRLLTHFEAHSYSRIPIKA
jgi:hypothetical protein